MPELTHEKLTDTLENQNLDPTLSTEPNHDKEAPDEKAVENKKIEKVLKSRMEASKRTRKQMYSEWKRNVELRIGKIASQFTGGINVEDEVQTEINPDWSLTKTKTANLYSQV